MSFFISMLSQFSLISKDAIKGVNNCLSSEQDHISKSSWGKFFSIVFSKIDDPQVIVKFIDLSNKHQNFLYGWLLVICQCFMLSFHNWSLNAFDVIFQVVNHFPV